MGNRAPYEFRTVRVRHRKAGQLTCRWSLRGWELVSRDDAHRRTRLTFGRESTPSRRGRRFAAASGIAAASLVIGVACVALDVPQRLRELTFDSADDSGRDSDKDGIPDVLERSGWTSARGDRLTSDPDSFDTDGDGLPDGLEAGAPVPGSTPASFDGPSDPRSPDTDGDGIGDADEFFLDMNPALADSDDDGLTDDVELEFGSDPTRANGDDDAWSDAEEHERGSAPLAYDLTKGQRADAAKAGAKYGDCYSCALDNGLREEQLESVYYLAGQVGSGVAGYGDIRDLAYNLWKRKWAAAAIAGVGLFPVYGDAAKLASTVTKFAARSERSAGAAIEFVKRLPQDVRKRLPASLTKRAVLPRELADGPTDNVVYLWKGTADCPTYVGITNNFDLRTRQHAKAGRCFVPEKLADGLTRGQAHALEEACLVQGGLGTSESTVQNVRRSINPSARYYEAAVVWGTSYLTKLAVSCR